MIRRYDIEDIIKLKVSGKKIAIYGAGLFGTEFKKFLSRFGIQIDLFIDNDIKKSDCFIDGIPCILPENLAGDSAYLTFICVNINLYNTVYEKAIEQGIINICDTRRLLDSFIIRNNTVFFEMFKYRFLDKPADLFFNNDGITKNSKPPKKNIGNDRIAVYTSAFGDYDDFVIPEERPYNIDYYFISDNKPETSTDYIWIDAGKYISPHISSPIKRNRYIKMHPHLIFPDYKYSIYVDANIQIKGDLSEIICESNLGISAFKHYWRDCLYYEAISLVNAKRIIPEDAIVQTKKYLSEKMPVHFGLTEMGVIAREHNKKKCINLMNSWWDEFDNYALRDQISFPYVLWKNHYTLNDMSILGNNIWACELFEIHKHRTNSENIHNEKMKNIFE